MTERKPLSQHLDDVTKHLDNSEWVYLNTLDQTDLNEWQYNLACSFANKHANSFVFIFFPIEHHMVKFNQCYGIDSLSFKNGSKIMLSNSLRMIGVGARGKIPNGFHNENMLFIVNKAHWFSKATNVMTAIKNTSTGRNNLILAIDDISQEEQKEYSSRFKIVNTNE